MVSIINKTRFVLTESKGVSKLALTAELLPHVIFFLFKSIGPMTTIQGVAIFEFRILIGHFFKQKFTLGFSKVIE